ncbi:MAG: hypothetical protein Q7S21_07785 [archaeon]|nr:hypothetical protein [archaeon]
MKSNKPLLFSIDHEQEAVQNAMQQFRQIISGKKFLFIELPQEDVDEILKGKTFNQASDVASYQKFVAEADKMGLKVIALDNKKFNDEYRKTIREHTSPVYSISFYQRIYYQMFAKRERHWMEILQHARANAIIVMHPAHAESIATALKLPKENIIGELQYRPERGFASFEATRIEAERLERRKRKAQERMRKPNRKM